MRVLVTGATGKVGYAIVKALAGRGDEVRALVRDPHRAARILPPAVESVPGDVTQPDTLAPAAEGCELVFNAVGLPEQWQRDESIFERVNAQGSANLARAARAAGVRRFVHTSTNDVFHAEPGQWFDETKLATEPKGTPYERSKQHAEELVLAGRDGMEVVILNPAAIYGPGPPTSSPSVDRGFFEPLVKGKLPALTPGGMGLAFADGVARGHLLAAERAPDGERYILCDRYVTLRELAETVVAVAGRGRIPPTLPVPLARAFAAGGEAVSRLTERPPVLSKGQLHYFLWNAKPDSSKAQRDLGWVPTPLEEGISASLAGLGLLPGA